MGTVHELKSAEKVKQDRLSRIPDSQLGCRLRHAWPVLRPGRHSTIPKNMRMVPQRDGCARIQETCRVCGKIRWKLTGVGGIYLRSAAWHYIQPKDWKVLRREWNINRQDLAAEAFERMFGGWIGDLIAIEVQKMILSEAKA
jgi:hypothetical protein